MKIWTRRNLLFYFFYCFQFCSMYSACLLKWIKYSHTIIYKNFFFKCQMRPKLRICLFPLTRPTLSKSTDWNVFIGNLLSLFFFFRFAQNSFCWKFRILDSFCQKINIFALSSTSLSSKKKPTYLPTSKIVGRVRGNRNIFNCGLIYLMYSCQ